MIVHLVLQVEKMMILAGGVAVIKTVGGVWTGLTVNKNLSQIQLLQRKMTGLYILID